MRVRCNPIDCFNDYSLIVLIISYIPLFVTIRVSVPKGLDFQESVLWVNFHSSDLIVLFIDCFQVDCIFPWMSAHVACDLCFRVRSVACCRFRRGVGCGNQGTRKMWPHIGRTPLRLHVEKTLEFHAHFAAQTPWLSRRNNSRSWNEQKKTKSKSQINRHTIRNSNSISIHSRFRMRWKIITDSHVIDESHWSPICT